MSGVRFSHRPPMIEIFDIPNIISTYGYLGIFIIVFLESGIFFALPGDTLLFTAGLMVSIFDMNLFHLISLIFVATFLGGIVGYEIGINLEKLRKFTFFRKILKEEHLNKTHEFFEKYGRMTIIISRFVVIARTFVPIVAGIAKMRYSQFLKYSFISSLFWSVSVTLLGYFLGQIFPHIKDYMTLIVTIIVILSILPIIWEMRRKPKQD